MRTFWNALATAVTKAMGYLPHIDKPALGLPVTMPDTAVILLAEDDEDHVLLIRRAFQEARLVNPLYVVPHGEAAIAYLKGEGKYANRAEYPLPAILLLDLKMPRKN